jgi:dethiobiotin synthetase
MKALIVSGTDTGMGRPSLSAMLMPRAQTNLWKPVQSGTKDSTDRETVTALTSLSDEHFRERYVLTEHSLAASCR